MRNGSRFQAVSWAVLLVIVVAILAGSAGLLLRKAGEDADVPLELARFCLTLMTATVITGGLTYRLNQRAARRARDDERARALVAALRELKAAFERIQVARFYLEAHPTPATFLDQIGAVFEARAHLHTVERDLHLLTSPVRTNADDMLDYLDGLSKFYRLNFDQLNQDAIKEEVAWSIFKNGGDQVSQGPQLSAYQANTIEEFIDSEKFRASEFSRSYHAATSWIYTELGA